MGLDEAQTIAVKHPNSLLYRLSVGVSGVKVTHFVAQASGASQGLDLQHTAQPVEGVLGHEGDDVKQQGASAAMLDSRWAKQTPKRARRLALDMAAVK